MGERGDKGIEVPAEDREASARLQLVARVAGHLAGALHAGLSWALGPFEEGAAVLVDGEPAFDGERPLGLVEWTRGRILGVAETAVAEAAAELLAEARADQVAALGRYIREDVRRDGVGRGAGSAYGTVAVERRPRTAGGSTGRGEERAAGDGRAAGTSGASEEAIVAAGGWAGRMFLTTGQAAEFLGLSPRTLEKMRITGGGPVFRKLGRRVVYSREDLEEWVAAGRRRSTSDPGPGQ